MFSNLWVSVMSKLNIEMAWNDQGLVAPTSNVYSIKRELEQEVGIVDPVHYLPNVRSFKVKSLADHHPILKEVDVNIRMSKPQFEFEHYMNHNVNKYVKHMILRLNRNRSNPVKF